MIVFPNCKINIGLNIIEKRTDGFHNISSVFYPIPLFDALEILKLDNLFNSIDITTSGFTIEGNNSDNLIYKAYQLLQKDFKLPAVQVILHKAIPMGAGLGGGSADAAFFLNAMNDFANLQLSQNKLLHYAQQLGSDCSFFILNKPMYATQKGETLESCPVDLNGKYIVLVKPNIHVSTIDAYAGVVPTTLDNNLNTDILKPIDTWKNNIKNDFEKTIFQNYPLLKQIKDKLYLHGALYCAMSGSGSTVYGIFENEINLKHAFLNDFYFGTNL